MDSPTCEKCGASMGFVDTDNPFWACPVCDPPESVCTACGEAVSYTDEGGCVGTLPNAYHFQAECLLEAARRAEAEQALYRRALERIRDYEGPEEYLDDVEVELKKIAREALAGGAEGVPPRKEKEEDLSSFSGSSGVAPERKD